MPEVDRRLQRRADRISGQAFTAALPGSTIPSLAQSEGAAMTGTAGGVVMLVGGGLMGTFGGLLFANHEGYTQQYLEDQRLWTRNQPVSEIRVALMRLMGLLLCVGGAVVFVVGLVLTLRGKGGLSLLHQSHGPVWVRVPPLAIAAIAIGQLVQSYRQREAPWQARMWTAAAVLTVGASGFAFACWFGYISLGVTVLGVTFLAFLLLARPTRRTGAPEGGTAERPHSPEGEQGRSEP